MSSARKIMLNSSLLSEAWKSLVITARSLKPEGVTWRHAGSAGTSAHGGSGYGHNHRSASMTVAVVACCPKAKPLEVSECRNH